MSFKKFFSKSKKKNEDGTFFVLSFSTTENPDPLGANVALTLCVLVRHFQCFLVEFRWKARLLGNRLIAQRLGLRVTVLL